MSANRSTVGRGTGVDVGAGRGVLVAGRVAVGRGVLFTVGVFVRVLVLVLVIVGTLDGVGALAVSVAKIFMAILASVPLASGVGRDVVVSPNGAQAAIKQMMQESTMTKTHLHMGTSLVNDHRMPRLPFRNRRRGCRAPLRGYGCFSLFHNLLFLYSWRDLEWFS